jgi:hypothetical protein
MRSFVRAMLAAVLVLGCSDPADPDPDPDPEPVVEVTDPSGAPVVSIELPATLVGESASATIRVSNPGAIATGPLTIALEGVDAGDFAIAGGTCAGASISPGGECTFGVELAPSAAGIRMASIVIVVGGKRVTIAVQGEGLLEGDVVLRLSPTTVDFARVEVGMTADATVTLHNDGTGPATIDDIAMATGTRFAKQSTTCGASLAGGAMCETVIRFSPLALGATSDTLVVSAEGATYSKPVAGSGVRRITVDRDGSGTGTVTSLPAEIDCGTTCSGLFEGGAQLTASPALGSAFTAWSDPACTANVCTVPAGTDPRTITATFTLATGSPALNVAFAGTAWGEVAITAGGTTTVCSTACTVPYSPGETVGVAASTPSTLVGITGACASSGSDHCSFTAPSGTSTVTARFDRDTNERWTFLGGLNETFGAADVDSAGNVIAASGSRVVKLDANGALVWAKPIAAARQVVAGSGNVIYLAFAASVQQLDSAGTVQWTKPFTSISAVAASPNGDVAISADGMLRVFEANGTLRWMAAGSFPQLDIDASGTIHGSIVQSVGPPEERETWLDVARFTATGTPLANVVDITSRGILGTVELQFVVDSNSRYFGRTTSERDLYLTSRGQDGIVQFQLSPIDRVMRLLPSGIAATGVDIAWVQAHETAFAHGFTVQRLSPAGGITWNLRRNATACGENGDEFHAIAGGPSGQLVLVGSYQGLLTGYCTTPKHLGWIQAFAP